MRGLPLPPTDNLYKYIAISGLWLLLVVILMWGFFFITIYNSDKSRQLSWEIYKLEENIKKSKKRIKSLENGKVNENRMEFSDLQNDPEYELSYLIDITPDLQKKLDNTRKKLERLGDPESDWELITSNDYNAWILSTLNFIASCFTYFGFRLWYLKTQKISDEILKLELKLKTKELRFHRKLR